MQNRFKILILLFTVTLAVGALLFGIPVTITTP